MLLFVKKGENNIAGSSKIMKQNFIKIPLFLKSLFWLKNMCIHLDPWVSQNGLAFAQNIVEKWANMEDYPNNTFLRDGS